MEQPSSTVSSAATPAFPTMPHAPRPTCYAFLAPAQKPDEIGRLGRFRVLKELGEGGMGIVFLADDLDLGRRVALKVMKPAAAAHEQGRKRFLREARAAAAVKHDHVVPIYQVGEDGGVPFLVMPFLQGESLGDRLRRPPKLTAAEAVRIARETAEGLAEAHAAGLVHRDVKPSNLWLEQRPNECVRVVVLDFGLALPMDDEERLTQSNCAVGTVGYMSPEQARAEPLDERTDLFSLGCVLYRMCTGRQPFRAAAPSPAPAPHALPDMLPPQAVDASVPAALSDLVMRLLSKDPTKRPASARQTAEELRVIESSLSAQQPPPLPSTISLPNHGDRVPRRRRTPILVLSLLPLIGVLALSALWLPPVRAWLFPNAGPSAPFATEWKGDIDVVVYDPTNPRRNNVHLNDPDVLPLKPGDQFAVEASLDRPGYMYILWIDADGTVTPVYPWKRGHWDERATDEKPLILLKKPEGNNGFKIKESTPGMDTLVLLARDTPLPPDQDLRTELGPMPRQTMQTLRSVAWFENGALVKNKPGRKGDFNEEKLDDPVLAAQEQIRTRLGQLFPYMRAVSFADQGK